MRWRPPLWGRWGRRAFSFAPARSPLPPRTAPVVALLGGLVGGAWYLKGPWAAHGAESAASEDDAAALPLHTLDEVAKHCHPDDLWIVIDGEVYDVTVWQTAHPGGAGILKAFGGQDVSREFAQLRHSGDACALRSALHVGTVRDYTPPTGLPRDLQFPPASPKGRRLVILGAGICGTSAAHHLAQAPAIRDQYDILVVDRGWMVGGTALKSSAIMFAGPLLEQRRENREAVGLAAWLGQLSYEMADRMHKEWEDVAFAPRPMLGLCFSAGELELAAKSKTPADELLTRDQALAREPLLQGNTALTGALLKHGCFTVDPFLVCNAYAKRAARAGVRFILGTEVRAIERQPTGAPFRLTTSSGPPIEADVLLLCAGAADAPLAAQVGHAVPVRPMHGQMYAVRLPAAVPALQHMVFSYEGPLYWKQRGDGANSTLDPATLARRCHHVYGLQVSGSDGICKFGGDRVEGDNREAVFTDQLAETKARVEEIFPTLQGAAMIGQGWGGTMPFTPDQNVIVGDLEPNLFVCTGSPFTKGAASGLLLALSVAERVAGGGSSLMASSGVDPDRLRDFLRQCRPQRFVEPTAPAG